MNINFIDLKPQYQSLKNNIDLRIQAVLEHSRYILGPEVEESEKALQQYTGSKHALTCASGTDALLMALMALDIGPGDEVITTSFSWISTAEVIVLVGAKPVFVDIEPDTYNIDANKIESAVTSRTKAIIPVSLFGQPADMDQIVSIANKHGLSVIEDAAQSFGADYKGRKSCNLSHIGCTSFFPTKPLACFGDGGAVFTNDDDIAEVLKAIRVHGETSRGLHSRVGITGRMDTLQCAILLAKLECFSQDIEKRQNVAQRYTEGLAQFEHVLRVPALKSDRTSVYAQYTLFSEKRDEIRSLLEKQGVPTAVYYPCPMHQQPPYSDQDASPLPVVEKAAKGVFSLPMYPDLDQQSQDYVIDSLAKVAKAVSGG